MKTKLIGLGILAAVIIAAVAYVFISNNQTVAEINGYVGGEKIGLLEDEEGTGVSCGTGIGWSSTTQGRFHRYGHRRREGRDFLFPSNQTALELYEQNFGAPQASESFSIRPSCCTPTPPWRRR